MLEELTKQVEELEAFKERLERQQLTYPLDVVSKSVIHDNLMVPTGKITYPSDSAGYGSDAIEFFIKDIRYLIKAK